MVIALMGLPMRTIVKRIFAISLACLLTGAWIQARAESPQMRRTLARLAAATGPFSFAVIGDNRSGDRVYQKIIKGMMARRPLFVVNTGDVIPNPGNREEWSNFWEISRPITMPYFLTPGNHDINSVKSLGVWQDEVDLPGNETYYSFVVGKNLFVVLNSCEPGQDRRIGGRQLAWLSRTLNPGRYQHQFVFLHHPLFMWSGASHEGRSLDRYPDLRDQLHRLFMTKGVDAVFLGHEHTYKRLKVDGLDYIVTGGAGARLYSGFTHFIILTVDGLRIEAKVIDRKGYLRDEFFLRGP